MPKDDAIFQCLGSIDELNANLGLAREYIKKVPNMSSTQLEEIQARLIDVGSHVATPRTSDHETKVAHTEFDGDNIKNLENWIDVWDQELPPLKNFILPSGGLAAS